jgi:hypothetical protein
MRCLRTITLTIASLMTLSAALPGAASAGPLLSGYGGPGEGSQAILGGGLVNGGGGGPPSGGGRPSIAASSGEPATARTGSVPINTSRGASGSGIGKRVVKGGRGAGKRPAVQGGSVSAGASAPLGVAARHVSEGSGTLGLSGEAILLLFLALGALIFTGLMTRRLARPDAASRHG